MQQAHRRERIPEIDYTHQFIGIAASCSANVLISAGNRCARETLAGLIHEQSGRREGPFIVLNGQDISDWRPALSFQGSLFIEEAQDLSSTMQARLLRFLEERAVRPVTARVMVGAAHLFDKVCSGAFLPNCSIDST